MSLKIKTVSTTHLVKSVCQCTFLPSGSTSLASFRDSDVAMSVLAAHTAKMMEFGFWM